MVVTSYEIVIADVKHLQRYPWKYIVVDEGHRLKNFNCKLLRELRTIPTANKLLLSGATPLCSTSACPCIIGWEESGVLFQAPPFFWSFHFMHTSWAGTYGMQSHNESILACIQYSSCMASERG